MVKCSECGYLAVRDKDSRELKEAEVEYRKRGLRIAKYEYIPICFVQVRDFRDEVINKKGASNLDNISIGEFISKEIKCELFTKWLQGLTPKEHVEMIDRERMLKWQIEREDADRKWRTKQQWFMVLVAGIFTIIGAVIVLLIGAIN